MEPIKLKSLVRLKSGGPIMTVKSFARKRGAGNPLTAMRIADESQLNCEWFDGSTLMQGRFDMAVLLLVFDPHLMNPLTTETAMEEAYTGLTRL